MNKRLLMLVALLVIGMFLVMVWYLLINRPGMVGPKENVNVGTESFPIIIPKKSDRKFGQLPGLPALPPVSKVATPLGATVTNNIKTRDVSSMPDIVPVYQLSSGTDLNRNQATKISDSQGILGLPTKLADSTLLWTDSIKEIQFKNQEQEINFYLLVAPYPTTGNVTKETATRSVEEMLLRSGLLFPDLKLDSELTVPVEITPDSIEFNPGTKNNGYYVPIVRRTIFAETAMPVTPHSRYALVDLTGQIHALRFPYHQIDLDTPGFYDFDSDALYEFALNHPERIVFYDPEVVLTDVVNIKYQKAQIAYLDTPIVQKYLQPGLQLSGVASLTDERQVLFEQIATMHDLGR